MNDKQILELSLRKLSEAFDEFIGECMKDGGPTKQNIAKARGYLPKYCKYSYKKKIIHNKNN